MWNGWSAMECGRVHRVGYEVKRTEQIYPMILRGLQRDADIIRHYRKADTVYHTGFT